MAVTQHVWHNTVRRGPQLRPYDSDRDNFLTVYFEGHGHYTHKFSVRYLEKKFGEKISPRGVRPPKFLNRFQMPPRAMRLQNFIPISQKLWPLASGNYPVQTEKMKNKVADVPPKPEVRPLSAMYRWIELGAPNFSPETVPLHHFRFLNYTSKTVDFVEISDRIKT